jgi:hypothetical protein
MGIVGQGLTKALPVFSYCAAIVLSTNLSRQAFVSNRKDLVLIRKKWAVFLGGVS